MPYLLFAVSDSVLFLPNTFVLPFRHSHYSYVVNTYWHISLLWGWVVVVRSYIGARSSHGLEHGVRMSFSSMSKAFNYFSMSGNEKKYHYVYVSWIIFSTPTVKSVCNKTLLNPPNTSFIDMCVYVGHDMFPIYETHMKIYDQIFEIHVLIHTHIDIYIWDDTELDIFMRKHFIIAVEMGLWDDVKPYQINK